MTNVERKAHWIHVNAWPEGDWTNLYQCSECGGRVESDYVHEPDYNFCPYCGAKIVTRENHGCMPGGAE